MEGGGSCRPDVFRSQAVAYLMEFRSAEAQRIGGLPKGSLSDGIYDRIRFIESCAGGVFAYGSVLIYVDHLCGQDGFNISFGYLEGEGITVQEIFPEIEFIHHFDYGYIPALLAEIYCKLDSHKASAQDDDFFACLFKFKRRFLGAHYIGAVNAGNIRFDWPRSQRGYNDISSDLVGQLWVTSVPSRINESPGNELAWESR